MKWLKLRLSTFMLFILVFALGFALLIQERIHRADKADLQSQIDLERFERDADALIYKDEIQRLKAKAVVPRKF